MIRFGTWSIVLLIGAVQGLFVSAGLLAKPTNRSSNVFLSALIFLLSLKLVPYIIGYAGFYMAYPWLDLAPFDLSLGFGPLLYLYIARLTTSGLPKRWPLHLLPLAVQFLTYTALFSQPLASKRHFEATVGASFNAADNLLDCLSFCLYLALTWNQWKGYEKRLTEQFANPELHRLRPLKSYLAIVTIVFLAFVGAKLWTLCIWPLSYYQMFPFYLLLTGVVYAFGFTAFQFSQVDYPQMVEVSEPRETDWAALAARYTSDLEDLAFWRDPLLSVAVAANALGTSEARLSRAINTGLGISFSAWINGYRIEQVAKRLASEESIIEIAQQCGFNSKASFNRWFRAVKGCTPTEFRQSQLASSYAPEPHRGQPQSPTL